MKQGESTAVPETHIHKDSELLTYSFGLVVTYSTATDNLDIMWPVHAAHVFSPTHNSSAAKWVTRPTGR